MFSFKGRKLSVIYCNYLRRHLLEVENFIIKVILLLRASPDFTLGLLIFPLLNIVNFLIKRVEIDIEPYLNHIVCCVLV